MDGIIFQLWNGEGFLTVTKNSEVAKEETNF